MMKMMGSWVGKIIDVAAPADCGVNYSKVKVKVKKKTKNNNKKKRKIWLYTILKDKLLTVD